MRARWIFFVLATFVGACLPSGLEQPDAESPSPHPSLPTTGPNHIRPASSELARTANVRPSPRIVVQRIEGADAEQVQRALRPVERRMRECTPGRTSLVQLRIQSDDTATRIVIEPGLALDASLRCILEALSTIDLDEASRSGPSFHPSGFTALVRVEWW